MNEFNPAKRDSARAEAVRRQYMERRISKTDQLQALHEKVKVPGAVASFIVGILGALVVGAGITRIMVWGSVETGLCLGIPGLVMILLAYPLYRTITGRRSKKYAQQIMALSEEIMGGKEIKQ